jgi:F-type H+-transporting ATPase subunit b
LVALFLTMGLAIAQEQPSAAQPSQAQSQSQNSKASAAASDNPNDVSEEDMQEEYAQLKYSPVVRAAARHLGMRARTVYWISLAINFVLIILFFYYLFRKSVPKMFADRKSGIQRGIREAQAASADAARRLSDIEARLSKLDTEVAGIRDEAEREAATEEQKIRDAAEQDKQRVVQGAEAEISAIARNARRELKTFAASLAVDLASSRIQVDENTDRTLVHNFADQLGKGGT